MQLRWFAVGGQVLTMLVVQLWLGIALPVPQMAGVILFLVGLNVVSLLRHRQNTEINHGELVAELLLDVTALTIQLYLSGGASNPFISLYLLQIVLGAVLLEVWAARLLVVVASGCFIGLIFSYRPLVLPPELAGELLTLHIQGMFVCFVLAASLLVFFIARINRNLRIRDFHLADLRQRAAEEDHIVRMGLLASGAAHELGTPLATLSVILNDWQRMPVFRSDPDLLQEAGEMQSQIDRCKSIVTGILMSSGEARGEGPVRTTVNGFVDGLVAEWRSHRSPIVLDYDNRFSPDDSIVSDPALKQVIFNVFDNALEASPHWVGVTIGRRGDELLIAVDDAGPGFDPTILAELGQPYRSTKQRPGSGLGLFLVVNVLRKLGGTVTARNRIGRGAHVTLALPLASLSPGAVDAS